MLGLYVTVPIACFRPGVAREFWETLPLPPPSTVYGFLLSMVGETDRTRHIGARCTAGTVGQPDRSTVLRRMWRIKELGGKSGATQGNASNVRPDYQQLLSNCRLIIFLDSSDETGEAPNLEARVSDALDPKRRSRINRFGGLSLGESTHMVDEVVSLDRINQKSLSDAKVFLVDAEGSMTLPVWVDHVGSAGTNYATGNLAQTSSIQPDAKQIPRIVPK